MLKPVHMAVGNLTLVNDFFLSLSITNKDIIVITLDTGLPTLRSPSSRLVSWCRIEPFVIVFFFTRVYVNSVINDFLGLWMHVSLNNPLRHLGGEPFLRDYRNL